MYLPCISPASPQDRCPEDLLVLLRNSSSTFVAMLMGSHGAAPGPATSKGGQVRGGRTSKFMGVVYKFQARVGLG
jgi:hypothetical protein